MADECSDRQLVQRLDEWKVAHKDVHALENREREAARIGMERRLDAMNEFRAALSDTQARSVSRELFDALLERVAHMERLIPIVALLSAVVGAATAGIVVSLVRGG